MKNNKTNAQKMLSRFCGLNDETTIGSAVLSAMINYADTVNTLHSDPDVPAMVKANIIVNWEDWLVKNGHSDEFAEVDSLLTEYLTDTEPKSPDNGWIPVSERLPEPQPATFWIGIGNKLINGYEIRCYVLTNGENTEIHTDRSLIKEQCLINFKSWGHITHWQPLPAPPKQQKP